MTHALPIISLSPSQSLRYVFLTQPADTKSKNSGKPNAQSLKDWWDQ